MSKLPSTTEIVLASDFRLRPAHERGHVDFGWLKSAHSFSFGSYFDPNHIQFGALHVINDDQVLGGAGFPMHPHKDAEIFSYVLEGALSHQDTLGNGSTVHAGGVQYMSAGHGVQHSEYNPSKTDAVRFLQIWLMPNVTGASPRYETLDISSADKDGKLKLFLSHDGRDDSMHIRADADVYAANLEGDQTIDFTLPEGRLSWVQVARGSVLVNGQRLNQGDGLAIGQGGMIHFREGRDSELLLFDLASFD